MQKEKITTDASSLMYHPLTDDLVLTVGVQLYYNYDTQKFELNQDPYGDPDPVPVHHVAVKDDFSELSFEANYRGLPRQFIITAGYDTEKVLLQLFAQLNNNGPLTVGRDMDHMQFIFDKGKLESIELYKHNKSADIIESWDVFLDKGNYVLVSEIPRHTRVNLDALEVNGNKLNGRAGSREYVFRFSTQPVLVDAIKRLVAIAL